MASDKGEFAVRGGIIDLFPVTLQEPFRLEFFEEVEHAEHLSLSSSSEDPHGAAGQQPGRDGEDPGRFRQPPSPMKL
jgi:hypothetical protein